jgi:hypothetical protein
MKADIETGKQILKEVLKEPPVQNRDTVFYYSREGRLNKASQDVKDLNAGVLRRPAVFGIFTRRQGQAAGIGSIVLLCAMIFLIGKLSNAGVHKIEGNTLSISAMLYEGNTFVVIKKKPTEKAYTGPVDIVLSPQDSTGSDVPVGTYRVYFTPDEEEFRFSLSMQVPKLLVLLHTENKNLRVKVRAE